jgi:hypothetical protein
MSELAAWLRSEIRRGERVTFTTFCALVSKHSPAMSPAEHMAIVGTLWNGRERSVRMER